MSNDMSNMLLSAGLRPTRRRIALFELLLATTRRYITAETFYDEAIQARCQVSRATVCSTLRQFAQAGLVKKINTPRSRKTWFVSDRDVIKALAEI